MNAKRDAKYLPCLFESLANEYDESQLARCETKQSQKWRHATANVAAQRITEMAKYFPELSALLDSLDDYSLCERHYNQIVVKKSFVKRVTKMNDSTFLDSEETERKRPRLSNDNELLEFEKTFSDAGVQVSLLDPAYEVHMKRIQELEDINQQLLSENAALKKQLDEAFNDQQGRIRSVTEIAKRERGNLYNDIISLKKNHERFSLDSLLRDGLMNTLQEGRNILSEKIINTNKEE
jgi:hypothetical protein